MSLTRRTEVEIYIEGKNVTADLKKYLQSITYTDVLEGEADTAQITLNDTERLFIDKWFPTRGDSVNLTFIKNYWADNPETLNLNDFEIDEITNTSNNSGNVAQIKLNSIANKTELRSTDKNRAWENVKLSKIAKDIADGANLTLFYDTQEDPEIKRAEQKEKSNLSFLYGLCKDRGIAVKISDNKLILFDVEKYEQADSVKTFTYGDGQIISFSGTATISKIYKSAHVKYQHGKKAEKQDYTYTDKSKESGMTIEINQRVENPAEAEKLAKRKLKEKNRDEITIRLNVIGDFALLAGNCIELKDYGFYDGKYLLKKVTHNVGSGYTCSVEAYKCLPLF